MKCQKLEHEILKQVTQERCAQCNQWHYSTSGAKASLVLREAQLSTVNALLSSLQLLLQGCVVCALPTKWSWGLSHASPPVHAVDFPPRTKWQSHREAPSFGDMAVETWIWVLRPGTMGRHG